MIQHDTESSKPRTVPAATDRDRHTPPLRLRVSVAAVTWVVTLVAVGIHVLNVPAVWFRHASAPARWKEFYVVFFGVSGEGKLPTFYSGLTMLLAAALLGLIAAQVRKLGGRYVLHWAALAVIFVVLAMDEMMVMHELTTYFVRSRLNIEGGLLYHAWVIPAFVFLVVLGVVYLPFLLALPKRTATMFIVAGGVFVAGAVGMEMIGGAYAAAYEMDLTYGVLATIEEVLEMGGMIIFLYALMDHLRRTAPDTQLHFVR